MSAGKKYTYKGKVYILLTQNLLFKNTTTREWEEAVKYIQLRTGLIFHRNQEEFFKKFKEVCE